MQNLYCNNGIPLIRPPMSKKKVSRVLTGDCINEGFFFTRKCMAVFCRAAKKSGRNNEVTVLARWRGLILFTLTFGLNNDSQQSSTVKRVWFWEARDGAVVRVLASHPRGPGSNPGVDAICGLSLLLVLSFAPRGFSPGTPVFPSPQKPTFPNSNSTRNQVDEEPLCGCATSKSFLFIYFQEKFW